VHGIFMSQGEHWFYKDNGSTNGSWVDGKEVKNQSIRIIRPGAVIQLADTALQVVDGGRASAPVNYSDSAGVFGRSAVVFRRGTFVKEFSIAEYGKALTIGGASGDLELEGDLRDAPALVFERRKTSIVAYSVAKLLPITVNGKEAEGTVELHDGDEVVLQEYTVIFQDPSEVVSTRKPVGLVTRGEETPGQSLFGGEETEEGQLPSAAPGDDDLPYRPSRKRAVNANFGRQAHMDKDEEDEEDELNGSHRTMSSERSFRSSMIFSPDDTGDDVSYSSLESKIVLTVVLVLLMALLALALFFVFGT
jgi:hypothetical protein